MDSRNIWIWNWLSNIRLWQYRKRKLRELIYKKRSVKKISGSFWPSYSSSLFHLFPLCGTKDSGQLWARMGGVDTSLDHPKFIWIYLCSSFTMHKKAKSFCGAKYIWPEGQEQTPVSKTFPIVIEKSRTDWSEFIGHNDNDNINHK